MLHDFRNVNIDLLRQRGEEIRHATSLLAHQASLPVAEFVADQTTVDAAKYRLIIAIEAAISICTHLSARLAGKAPATYAQCFEELARSGIVTQELAGWRGWPGFATCWYTFMGKWMTTVCGRFFNPICKTWTLTFQLSGKQ